MYTGKKIFNRKAGVKIGAIASAIAIMLFASYSMTSNYLKDMPVSEFKSAPEDKLDKFGLDDGLKSTSEKDPEWHTICEIKMERGKMLVTGEADPGGSNVGGWLSTFFLDYDQEANVVLQNNATDWGASSDVHLYIDTDDTQATMTNHSDPFYPAVRTQFNRTQAHDGDKFIDGRCRVFFTMSGDETISNVNGTAVVSNNDTGDECIHINWYWDDEDDGYRILAGGSFNWNITIQARY